MTMQQRKLIWVWSFLALPVLFYGVIRFYPTFEAFRLSLTDWDLLSDPSFIGLENYRRMFDDPNFWKVFRNTFTYLILGTPISLLLAFVIAWYLDRVRFAHTLIRTLYFLPFVTTAAAMAWVWLQHETQRDGGDRQSSTPFKRPANERATQQTNCFREAQRMHGDVELGRL